MKKQLKFTLISSLLFGLAACSNSDVRHSWCPPEKTAVTTEKPGVTTEEITLSADAVFHFNKSMMKDMLPKGKTELEELVKYLNNSYKNNVEITVVGHTDRLGSESYNYNLGLKRAETVKVFFNEKGYKNVNFSSMGEKQPVTTGCKGNKATPSLTACLQPDRRITIKFTGEKIANN